MTFTQPELPKGAAVEELDLPHGEFKSKRPMTDLERQHKHRERARDLGELPSPRSRIRKGLCRNNLLKFGLWYCMEAGELAVPMLKRAPSKRMRTFVKDLEGVVLHGGNKHVRWPRGKGKTTWVKIAAMWALLYGHRHFILMVAKTKQQAKNAIEEIWQRIQSTDKIVADFPEFALPMKDVALTPQRSRVQTYHGIQTRIAFSPVGGFCRAARLEGYPQTGGILMWCGADQAIRGTNVDSQRPDFVFIDDPQSDEGARNPQTVSKIEDLVVSICSTGETGATIAAVMASTPIEPDDVSERFADRERHPEWFTTTEKLVVAWGDEGWIEQYFARVRDDEANGDPRHTQANKFYIEHRNLIERGVEMMDDKDFDPKSGEVSAYHHALNKLKEWKRKKFDAEMQMLPTKSQGVFKIDATTVAGRVNGLTAGIIPSCCENGAVAFCDVNAIAGLRWVIACFGSGRVVTVPAYGRYPEKGRLYPEGTPESAIPAFLTPAIQNVAQTILRTPLRTESGETVKVDGICFDGGWQTETVASACEAMTNALGSHVVWSKGFPETSYRPQRAKPGMRGEMWHISEGANGAFLAFNSPYWKEMMQSMFLVKPLSPSSISLWGDSPTRHYDFATEVTADVLKAKWDDPKTGMQRWEWDQPGGNHYGDALYGALVYGSCRGRFDAVAQLVDAAVYGLEFKSVKAQTQKRRKFVLKK